MFLKQAEVFRPVAFGISLFAVGCELLNKMNLIPEYVIKLHILQFELPSIVIVIGIITIVFPLFGCIGALRESKCFLISYGTLLMLTIIVQTALFCYLFCWSSKDIENVLNIAWAKNTNDFKYPMDGYQFLFACCGLKSYEDYLENSKKIPSTCCGYLAGECEEELYKSRPGCRQTVVNYWDFCINFIKFTAIIAVALEIMTLMMTCYLFRRTLFLIFGVAEIILGWIVLKKAGSLPHYNHEVDPLQAGLPFVHIVIGFSTAVTPIFLVTGLVFRSGSCLLVYVFLTLMAFLMNISSSIYFFVEHDRFSERIERLIEDAWSKNSEEFQYPMDGFQIGFDCCGMKNYQDYLDALRLVPSSCCGSKKVECELNDYIEKPGCRTKFIDFWVSNNKYIYYRGTILGSLQLISVVMIYYLHRTSHGTI
uniref:Tetraspanin n=1 Tax=Glossina brevipalpis TaxID=37001 RepID=A0A1A9WI29_9MUSC